MPNIKRGSHDELMFMCNISLENFCEEWYTFDYEDSNMSA